LLRNCSFLTSFGRAKSVPFKRQASHEQHCPDRDDRRADNVYKKAPDAAALKQASAVDGFNAKIDII
jgi:hypothetical protein